MGSTLNEEINRLVLSANELKEMTSWPEALIEDYLNILDSIVFLAQNIDNDIDLLNDVHSLLIVVLEGTSKNRARVENNYQWLKDINNLLLDISEKANKARAKPLRIDSRTINDISNPADPNYRAKNTTYQNLTGRVLKVHLTVKVYR